jgi:hypothetical protein
MLLFAAFEQSCEDLPAQDFQSEIFRVGLLHVLWPVG